ncbi:hypothetical protein D9V86_01390 [Bacteroidetes/Chlorobi group bacterium ChocPot_Mid]|nr:MAG: hypothetical protein D9V86_01390 [Bacteroidetes/Chlorobi group bacterium ChocPot_Mid]
MRFKILILFLILRCFFGSNVFADDTNVKKNISESASTFSKQDTARLFEPYKNHGSVNKLFGDSYRKINKVDLVNKEYHGFSEMVEEFVPAYSLNLGSPGLFNSFSFFGTNPNNISFSFNGRPMIDVEYSSLNPEQLCTEFFENVEVLTGSDAVILGDNSSGALINLQEIRYNTKAPYTKLWYSQGGNSYLSADGIFSQNFAPNFNFNFGFRRQSGAGRYKNSWVDAWNVRGGIRWTPDERTNITLLEYFTNQGIGLNGGIDKSKSIGRDGEIELFDNNYAIPYYSDFNERVFRHDLTLSITKQLSEDSSSVISGNVYISNSNWEVEKIPMKNLGVTDTTFSGKYLSRYYGANISYEQRVFKELFVKAGVEAYKVDIEKFIYHELLNATSIAGFALAKLDIFDFMTLSGGFRLRNFNNKTILSEGAKLRLNINGNNNVFFDFSLSERLPSLVEGLDLESERNFLFLAEYEFKNNNTTLTLGTSFRSIENKIYYYDVLSEFLNAEGFTGTLLCSYVTYEQRLLKHFVTNMTLMNNYEMNGDLSKYPPLILKLTMYYELESGRSDLKIGVSGKYLSSFNGMKFLPEYRQYMLYEEPNESMFDGLKIFAVAKLGNAYVKASLENLLGSGYYVVPIYPYYNRNFRLSFIWSFLD